MEARPKPRVIRKLKATTGDIVGGIPPAARVPRKWQKQYHRLIKLRQSLVERQAALAKDALEQKPTFSTHMADAGSDTFDRDFAIALLSSEHDAVFEVDQALERIRDGTYGICEYTGKRIEPRRLEAIPWTRFCLAAELELELNGATSHARLGKLESVVVPTPPSARAE